MGRVGSRRRGGGRRRRRKAAGDDDDEDEDDEEYVAGEDEEDEDCDEEEEFALAESDGGSDSGGEAGDGDGGGEEEEEEEYEFSGSGNESFEAEYEDSEEEVRKSKANRKKRGLPPPKAVGPGRRRKREEHEESEYEEDDDGDEDFEIEDEEEEETPKVLKWKLANSRVRVRVSEGNGKRKKPRAPLKPEKKLKKPKKRRRRSNLEDDEDDEEDEDFVLDDEIDMSSVRPKKTGKRKRRQDEDFVVDDERELNPVRPKKTGKRKKRQRMFQDDEEEDDEDANDEDFILTDEDVSSPRKKVRGRMEIRTEPRAPGARRKAAMDSDTSEFNYGASENDVNGDSLEMHAEMQLPGRDERKGRRSRQSYSIESEARVSDNAVSHDYSFEMHRETQLPERDERKERRNRQSYSIGSEEQDSDYAVSQDDSLEVHAEMQFPERNERKGRRNRQKYSIGSEAQDSDLAVSLDDSLEMHAELQLPERDERKGRRNRHNSIGSEAQESDYAVSQDDSLEMHAEMQLSERDERKGRRNRQRYSIGSEPQDSDYVVSQDESRSLEVPPDESQTLEMPPIQMPDPVIELPTHIESVRNIEAKGRRRKPNEMAGSESSDSDYVMSEEEFPEQRKPSIHTSGVEAPKVMEPSKELRGKRKRKKSNNSDSSDSDYVISEDELRDLGVFPLVTPMPEPKTPPCELRIVIPKRLDKGKAKELAQETAKPMCGICLTEEQRATIQGVLNCCSHYFCFACIMEWSKVETKCPLCKRRFETITKSSKTGPSHAFRKTVFHVEKKDQVYQPTEEELRGIVDPYENVVCIECLQGGDDYLMLLCDICDSPAHTYCVGLGRVVPEGNWYCDCCRSATLLVPADNQVVDTGANVGPDNVSASSSNFCIFSTDSPASVQACPSSQRSIQNPRQYTSQQFDLNLSPRDFPEEDCSTPSPASQGLGGRGRSTLSGRREIRRYIQEILANNRQSHLRPPFSHEASQSFGMLGAIEEVLPNPSRTESSRMAVRFGQTQYGGSPLLMRQQTPGFRSNQQNSLPQQQQRSLLLTQPINNSNFTTVEGAKEHIQSIVRNSLQVLCGIYPLGEATVRNIMRRATHTILAACRLDHNRSMVSPPFQFVNQCSHCLVGGAPPFLSTGCCTECLKSFAHATVSNILRMAS